MAAAHWEHLHHGSDIGVRGIGGSIEEAFEQAALALTAVITDPTKVALREAIEINCEAPDAELLLVDWLNSLIYEMSTRHLLFGRYSVKMRGSRLQATAWGESVDVARHEPAVEIKGATFTGLRVQRGEAGTWLAECVVDV